MPRAPSAFRSRKQALPTVVASVLEDLLAPAAADGAAVIALERRGGKPVILCETRQGPAGLLGASGLLAAGAEAPAHGLCPGRHPILVGPWQAPSGQPAVLAFWRQRSAASWQQQDHALILMAAAALGALLKHVVPAQESRWRNAIDNVTGLPKARKFVADLPRHFARLDQDGLPGTLIVLSIDGFTQLKARLGRKATEEMLRRAADLLNRITRPTDVVARLAPDEFALWLNGTDHMTAAERAEHLRLAAPPVLAAGLEGQELSTSVSIGIAARNPGSPETIESLMSRADLALHEAKSAGPGLWRVSHEAVG